MTFVQKLSIQGVRSFSPDQPQKIDFFPLTIILGENGAGKTTIIESLKFACCGQLPPNCNGGRSFVHDIHMEKGYDNTSVRGQIRFKFLDTERHSSIITRSLQTSLKNTRDKSKSQVIFKSLNSNINRDGKSIDQKCADINSLALDLIGVSKAMLCNVIFCHQEETTWPLSEGKVLKEKFDAIFGSIGYVKALDKIKKTREEALSRHALLKKDIELVVFIRNDLADKRRQANEENIKLASEKEKIRQLETKFNESDAILKDFIEKESNGEEVMNHISQLRGSISEKIKLCDSIRQSCNIDDLSQLNVIVNEDCDSSLADLLENKQQSEEQLQAIEWDYLSFLKSKQAIATEEAKVGEFEKLLQRYSSQRNDLVLKTLRDEHELQEIVAKIDNQQSLDSNDVERLDAFYDNKALSLTNSILTKQQEFEQLEANAKENLDVLKAQRSGKLHEKTLQQVALDQARQELIRIEALENSNSQFDVVGIENQIVQLSQRMNDLAEDKENDLKIKLKKGSQDLMNLNAEADKMDKLVWVMSSANEQKQELETSKTALEDKVNSLRANNRSLFESLEQDKSLFDQITEQLDQLHLELDIAEESVGEDRNEFYAMKASFKSLQDSLQTKLDEMNRLHENVSKVCDIQKFDDIFSSTRSQLNQLRQEKSKLENTSPLIDYQINEIKTCQTCPVCENDLSKNWMSNKSKISLNASVLVDKLAKQKGDTPVELIKLEEKLKQKEDYFQSLTMVHNDIKSIHKIQASLPSIRKQIEVLQDNLDKKKKQIHAAEAKINSFKSQICECQKCLPDAQELDKTEGELANLGTKLAEWKRKHADSQAQDVDQLELQCKERRQQAEKLQTDLDGWEEELNRFMVEKSETHNQLQSLERKKLEYEKNRQGVMQAIKRKMELDKSIQDTQHRLHDLQSSLELLQPKIEEAELELTHLVKMFNRQIKTLEGNIATLSSSKQLLESVNKEIDKYNSELNHSKLVSSKSHIEALNRQIDETLEVKKILAEEIKSLCQEISQIEIKKKRREDCIRLQELQAGLSEQQSKLSELEAQLGHLDLASIKQSRIKAERDCQSILMKKQTFVEHTRERIARLNLINKEMASDKFKDIEHKYRDKLIDRTLSEVYGEDLNKYYKALDYSIAAFHHAKMDEINKLLKKLWNIAYQGRDIQHIEIASDEAERSAADRRRVFDYRVVMIQRGVPLDMKAHCSAGQKMLACLIIRLALAIIFCSNFSVITLDEPTTNLDKNNIQSFAKAIVSLAKSQKNFQIIIITHDAQFLKFLNLEAGGSFYRIFKNNRGYSTIVQVNSEEEDYRVDDRKDNRLVGAPSVKKSSKKINKKCEDTDEEEIPRKRRKNKSESD